MIVNQAALTGIYKSFNTLFNETLETTQTLGERVAMLVPSAGASIDYKWLGTFPMLREWIGERQIKNLTAFEYSVKNKDFEGTVEVDRNDVEDDQIGVYRPIIQGLASNAKLHPDYLIFQLLKNAISQVCYDGQYFFDTDHPVAGASVSNYGGGSGTLWYLLDVSKPIKPLIFQNRRAPAFVSKDQLTDENVFMKKKFLYGVDYRGNAGYGLWQLGYASKQTLDATNYEAGRAAMMSFKSDEGTPLNITPQLLVVPPTLEGAANTLIKTQVNAAGASNPWFNTAEVLVVPWLA